MCIRDRLCFFFINVALTWLSSMHCKDFLDGALIRCWFPWFRCGLFDLIDVAGDLTSISLVRCWFNVNLQLIWGRCLWLLWFYAAGEIKTENVARFHDSTTNRKLSPSCGCTVSRRRFWLIWLRCFLIWHRFKLIGEGFELIWVRFELSWHRFECIWHRLWLMLCGCRLNLYWFGLIWHRC